MQKTQVCYAAGLAACALVLTPTTRGADTSPDRMPPRVVMSAVQAAKT